MADIAQIGFGADTSQLVAAETQLNALPPAVNNVEKASRALSTTLTGVSAAAKGVASSITAANSNFNAQSSTIDKVTASYKKLSDIQKQINAATGVSGGNDNIGRAADIDAYGKSLDQLRAKYNPLFAAGQAYKATLADINNALKVGAINEKEHASAITNTKAAFAAQVNNINRSSDAVKGLSYQAQNLSYQLVDVTQGILSGQPIFQIFAQQAGQIGQVIATTPGGLGGLMKELGAKISALLTPMRLAALGFIALGAAALIAITSTISSSRALDDLSKSIDVALPRLHALQQSMSFKGISVEDSAEAMKSFAQNVFDANQSMGSLRGLMIANNMQAKTFDEYLNNVADLVQRASTGMQKQAIILAAGLPATQQWIEYLNQGSKGIKAATDATVQFNDAAEKNLIQKARDFDAAWKTATTKMAQYFKSSVIEAVGYIDSLGTKTTAVIAGIAALIAGALAPFSLVLAGLVGLVAAALAAKTALQMSSAPTPTKVFITGGTQEQKPSGPDPKTQEQLLNENRLAQQRIGILGDLATVTQQVTLKQLELTAAGLQDVGVSDAMAKKILNLTEATARNNQVQAQAAAGVFNLNDANKAAAMTLQYWIDKKLLDPTNTEQMAAAQAVLAKNIQDTSDKAKLAATSLPQLQQLMLDSTNVAKVIDTQAVGAVNSLSSALKDMFNGTVSVGQGFKNMGGIIVGAIQQMIIQLLIIGPLMKAAFGAFGFNLSLPGMPSLTKSAKGNIFANDNIQKFANGGMFTNSVVTKPTYFASGGKMNEMGEAGPEAVMPLKRGPDGSLGVQMYGGSNNGGSQGATVITYAPIYNVGGKVSQEDLDAVKAAQADDRKKFTSRVASSQRELSRRNYTTGAR